MLQRTNIINRWSEIITCESCFEEDKAVTGYKGAHRQKDRYMLSFRNILFHRKGTPTCQQIALNRNSIWALRMMRTFKVMQRESQHKRWSLCVEVMSVRARVCVRVTWPDPIDPQPTLPCPTFYLTEHAKSPNLYFCTKFALLMFMSFNSVLSTTFTLSQLYHV